MRPSKVALIYVHIYVRGKEGGGACRCRRVFAAAPGYRLSRTLFFPQQPSRPGNPPIQIGREGFPLGLENGGKNETFSYSLFTLFVAFSPKQGLPLQIKDLFLFT